MRFLVLLAVGVPVCVSAQGQPGGDDGVARCAAELKALSMAGTDVARDSINMLLKTTMRTVLDQEQAMEVPFTDVPMGIVEPPDKAFRLFTWNVPREDGSHRFEGFLLLDRRKGPLLIELTDRTKAIGPPENVELEPDHWYGAIYYGVVPQKRGGKTYYTLLGWKGYSKVETRKVIDVLRFRGDAPRFGAPLFDEGGVKKQRRVFAYSFQASMSLRYDPNTQRIVFDHLSPVRADMEGQPSFYGPDLSYDAYFWDKGTWTYQRDVDARGNEGEKRPWNAPPKGGRQR
ncbi:MAG: hypothetical protein H6595_12430 [Flavobacteriales bacterium]|nr:hypothetical protein [Flavobacteriales bacterium]MCB9168268.1 hypothetical protein [Flavobacteriales bacterium]